jgi:hypothetical protein
MIVNCNLLPANKEETVKIEDMTYFLRNQQDIYYYEEEEDSNEDDEIEESNITDEKPMCGCGTPLSPGWSCVQCRHNCTTCHRALMLGEVCSRCRVEHNTKSTSTTRI